MTTAVADTIFTPEQGVEMTEAKELWTRVSN